MKKRIYFIIALLCLSCQKEKFENQENIILEEIFLSLVDSLHKDMRLYYPPPRPHLDFKTHIEDTVGFHKIKLAYEKRLKKIKNDSSKLVIIIRDSTEFLMPYDQEQLSKHFKNINVKIDSSGITKINSESIALIRLKNLKARKLNLKKYLLNKKYDFKYASTTNKKEYDYMKFPDKPFGGILGFSNIKLDESGQFGIVTASLVVA